MSRLIRVVVLAALVAAPSWRALTAQAILSGSVEGPDGEPLVGAVVTVRPLLDATLRIQVETDEQGRFRMENFNPSRGYRFHVAKAGYRALLRDVEAGLHGTSADGVLRQEFVLFPVGVNPTDEESRLLIMSRQSAASGPYQRGIRAFERGDWEKARQRLESARRIDPELEPVHQALALVYHRLGEYQAGLEAAEQALEMSPWDPDLLRIRYEALVSLGRPEDAGEALDKLAEAATDRSTAIFFHNDGVAALKSGDHASAETMLRTALRLAPEMIEAKDSLAKAYALSGKYESALALSAEVLEVRPGDLELLRLRQEAWSALGRTQEALAALEDLVRQDPGPRTATLLYNQGVKEFNAGDDAGAERSFTRALGIDSDSLQARIGLAEVYLRQKRWEECLKETERIAELSPGNADAQRIAERARARMAH